MLSRKYISQTYYVTELFHCLILQQRKEMVLTNLCRRETAICYFHCRPMLFDKSYELPKTAIRKSQKSYREGMNVFA